MDKSFHLKFRFIYFSMIITLRGQVGRIYKKDSSLNSDNLGEKNVNDLDI